MAKVDETAKQVDDGSENPEGNPPEKDMMNEGAPVYSESGDDSSPEDLGDDVTIVVEEGGEKDDEAGVDEVDVVDRQAADEAVEEDAEPDPLAALQAELAQVQAQAAEYLDKMQRTAAEYQNSRRRQEKQMADEIQRANGQLIKRLLPILDDFNLAFDNVPEQWQVGNENGNGQAVEQAWISGFRQIHKKLLDTLTEQGLEVMDASGPFDPALHEAISSEPSDTVESGHIIETLRAGYVYKGQVVRPALIRVAA